MATSPSPSAPEGGSLCSASTAPEAAFGRGSVALAVEDGIADLVLRRAETRNAIAPALLAELERTLGLLERADAIKVLVLRGEGRSFCVGVDVPAVEGLPPPGPLAFFWPGRALIHRLERLKVPTVAAVNGLA